MCNLLFLLRFLQTKKEIGIITITSDILPPPTTETEIMITPVEIIIYTGNI